MQKHFITGLLLLLPIALTFIIVGFLVNLLTDPFIDFTEQVLEGFGLLNGGFLFFSKQQILKMISRVAILLLLLFFTTVLGVIARWFFLHTFIRVGEKVLHRIPLVNTVYKTSKDVIQTLFTQDSISFKQVALVPFPSKSVRSIGLVTKKEIEGTLDSKFTSVFVPTTPNPTSGFLVMFPQDQVTYLDMTVEDAFKCIISCGIITCPFKEKK